MSPGYATPASVPFDICNQMWSLLINAFTGIGAVDFAVPSSAFSSALGQCTMASPPFTSEPKSYPALDPSFLARRRRLSIDGPHSTPSDPGTICLFTMIAQAASSLVHVPLVGCTGRKALSQRICVQRPDGLFFIAST
jgi:hypothetical protein